MSPILTYLRHNKRRYWISYSDAFSDRLTIPVPSVLSLSLLHKTTAGQALAKPPAVLHLNTPNGAYVQDYDNHFCQRLQSNFTGLLRNHHKQSPVPPIDLLLWSLWVPDHSRLLSQRHLSAGQNPHAKGLQSKVLRVRPYTHPASFFHCPLLTYQNGRPAGNRHRL